MATAPEQVRAALQAVTNAAGAEVRAVVAAAPKDPAGIRAALFATVPLIVSEYAPGAATLSLDWYEEIRDEARPPHRFTPTPRLEVTEDNLAAIVAQSTDLLHEMEKGLEADLDRVVAESMAKLEAELAKGVAAGFWDTTVGNAKDDPDTVGWQRFAKPGACKFCVMLADRGAVYTKTTVHFSAHGKCHCVVGPAYDPHAPKADVMQYVAAQRRRSEAERARLRKYLNQNFPDAPG